MAMGGLNKEQNNPFMLTATQRKSQKMQATGRFIFSGSEKKYIEQSRSSVKSLLQNKKKRAPWDLKGKLQDAVALNYDLMEKFQEMKEKEKNLVEDKLKLKEVSQQCTEDVDNYNKRIMELKQKLCDVTNKVEVAEKERDEAIFETQCENQELRALNKKLKSRVASLEMNKSDVSNLLSELHSEFSYYSLLWSKSQEELKELHKELERHANVYGDLKLEWEVMEQQFKELHQNIKKMKARKMK